MITNNADRLANHLYTHFDPPATHVLVEEIYVLVDYKEKENRLALIIYCLSQVSLKLNDKNKGEFIKMVLYNIRKLLSDVVERQHPRSSRIILIFLGMLAFFMNSTLISEQDNFETLIGELAHLVFITDPSILALVHKIYLILLADVKERKTALYYRQLVVSLENNARVGHLIWKERDITKDYISAAVKGLAYGCVTVMDESIQLL